MMNLKTNKVQFPNAKSYKAKQNTQKLNTISLNYEKVLFKTVVLLCLRKTIHKTVLSKITALSSNCVNLSTFKFI